MLALKMFENILPHSHSILHIAYLDVICLILYNNLQRDCHNEFVEERIRHVEQTREAVANSVGDNMDRMLRLM